MRQRTFDRLIVGLTIGIVVLATAVWIFNEWMAP